jgi:hypothetical protein
MAIARTSAVRVATAFAGALLLAALLLTGCGAPPGVGPMRTARPTDDPRPPQVRFGEKMLAEITANEQKLGRALAPARIIRVQRLDEGELYELRHFDGSNPDGGGVSSSDGPGWVVEAVGTFIDENPGTGQIDALGTHGVHLWDDAGGESVEFIPCWTRQLTPPDRMEGQCEGAG